MASSTPAILGQRDAYFEALFEIFKADKDCVIITADNGAPSLDQFTTLPGQFYTVGIAEQAMVAMAAGMALEGKRVWIYAIAPFVTTRVHEFVKLDVCAHNLPITILGVGAGLAYDNMGASHHTLEDISIMRALNGLEIYSPADSVTAAALASMSYERKVPMYIRFDRSGIPNIYDSAQLSEAGFYEFGAASKQFVIVATGIMTHQAMKVWHNLDENGLKGTVLDVYRPWPFDKNAFCSFLANDRAEVITLEEHFLSGGLGSIVSEALHDAGMTNKLLRIGMPPQYVFEYGGRELLWQKYGLDVDSIVKRIMEWL